MQNRSLNARTVITAATVTSFTALQPNKMRHGMVFSNSDANPCFVKFGATASTSSFNIVVPAGGNVIMDNLVYTGLVDAVWGTAGTGNLSVTEF